MFLYSPVDATKFMLENVIFLKKSKYMYNFHNCHFLKLKVLDEPNKQLLEIRFESVCIVIRRLLDDHLKYGKYPYGLCKES